MTDFNYCAQQVERFDKDRYLCTLFAPPDRRPGLFALYAFNQEVAQARELVSEPLLGHMRLQWWADALEGIYGGTPPAHPVARPLSETIQKYGLNRRHFEDLLQARRLDMEDIPPADPQALTDYASGTAGTLSELTMEVIGAFDRGAREAARHVGTAWALTGLLRAVPYHAKARRCYLPASLCREAGVQLSELYELRSETALLTVTGEVAAMARHHLDIARLRRTNIPKTAVPALLTATLADVYLKRMRVVNYDPLDARVQLPAPGRLIRLLWNRMRNRY